MKDFRTVFKTLARNKKAECVDHVLYAIMKAMTSKTSDDKLYVSESILRLMFTPIKNKKKLNFIGNTSYTNPYFSLRNALAGARNMVGKSVDDDLVNCIETDDERKHFVDIADTIYISLINTYEFNYEPYMYYFVDKDLNNTQKAVQVSHVAMLSGDMHPRVKQDCHFVVCEADKAMLEKLTKHDNFKAKFIEPYMNYRLTSVSIGPIFGTSREEFKDIPLINLDKMEKPYDLKSAKIFFDRAVV